MALSLTPVCQQVPLVCSWSPNSMMPLSTSNAAPPTQRIEELVRGCNVSKGTPVRQEKTEKYMSQAQPVQTLSACRDEEEGTAKATPRRREQPNVLVTTQVRARHSSDSPVCDRTGERPDDKDKVRRPSWPL